MSRLGFQANCRVLGAGWGFRLCVAGCSLPRPTPGRFHANIGRRKVLHSPRLPPPPVSLACLAVVSAGVQVYHPIWCWNGWNRWNT